jgi:hypothetical protein
MKYLLIHLLAFLAVTTQLFGAVTGTPARIRVLFIGNSYTNTNHIPGIVDAIASANGHPLSISVHVRGGRTWEQHWKEGVAQTLIRQDNWDIIVLQNQSYEPVGDPANMLAYAKKFAELIDSTSPNVRKILYNTWAYRDLNSPAGHQKKYPNAKPPQTSTEMQARLNDAYRATADAIGAEIAPVGQAWELALTAHPDLVLHADDGSHPNRLGAYLAAMTIYATFFHTPPKNLPGEIILPSRAAAPDAKPMTLTVSTQDRLFLTEQVRHALAAIRSPSVATH